MDWSAHDLRALLSLGRERGAHLLTAGELRVLARIDALPDPALGCWARLTARVHAFQRADDAGEHVRALTEAGLIDALVPWPTRARHATVAELAAGARRLGLQATGRRDALVARMEGARDWSDTPWIRVRHRGLVRRIERFALLRAWPDRSELVVERLGHVRWPEYALTPGSAAFPHRRALLAWEAHADAIASGSCAPERLLDGLADARARGPGRLDLERATGRVALAAIRAIERSEPERARALYDRLAALSPRRAAEAGLRAARALEVAGDTREALVRLRGLRDAVRGPERLAVHRAGRRVARAERAGWAPDPPLRSARERTLALPRAPDAGPRPLWSDGVPVERAVVARLADAGRLAEHAESTPWTSLFVLLFADALFLPVAGQLPVPRLPGPLDLGTPAFAGRRRAAIDAALADLRAGRGAERITRGHALLDGRRVSGLAHAPLEAQLTRFDAIGPALLEAVLVPLLARGWSAAAGLPDLLVPPGSPVTLSDATPSRVGPELHLVEVKGPGDTLSDAQRVWIDALAPVARVELWSVRPASGGR